MRIAMTTPVGCFVPRFDSPALTTYQRMTGSTGWERHVSCIAGGRWLLICRAITMRVAIRG
jgi:hypothetical protein